MLTTFNLFDKLINVDKKMSKKNMSKKSEKSTWLSKLNLIYLICNLQKKQEMQKTMIFENWAKRQFWVARKNKLNQTKNKFLLESLILAQDERWRHA